jgi:tetratricopeptide (TPR) repeat protein
MVLALISASLSAQAAPMSPTLRQGIANYNKGYIQKAIPLFKRAAQQSPNSEMAWVWLGRALKKQGGAANFSAAQDAFERALSINPDNIDALVGLAEILGWSTSTRPRAVQLLQQADRIKPGEPAIIKQLAQVLYWEGRYQEALEIVEPVADRFTNDKGWMATYASILARTGNPERAVQIFESSLQADSSKDFYLRQAYAVALFQSGQGERARQVFESLREQVDKLPAEKQPPYKLPLAGLAYDMGMYEEALSLDQSLPSSVQEADTGVMLRMARSLAKLQRTPEAIEQFQRVYQSGRMLPTEKVEYADYLTGLDVPPDNLPAPHLVETLYQEALRDLSSNKGPVYLRLARYYSNQEGQTEEALRAYWQALNNTPYKDQGPVQKEFLDYLKSDRVSPSVADQAFQELLSSNPDDTWIKGAYAEYLSYQPSRRAEAIKLYVQLINADPANKDTWRKPLERVLGWERPKADLIPLYQEIISLFPDSKEANLALARAYQLNPKTRGESLRLYQALVNQYPDDAKLKREWASILIGDESRRREALAMLRQLVADNPSDLSMKIAYAKVLSYEHQFERALRLFNQVLAEEPDNRDALLGKGYTLMFDGQKLAALDMFKRLRRMFPEDVEVAMGLAEANRAIGRYDKALQIIKEVKPLLNYVPQPAQPVVWDTPTFMADAVAVYGELIPADYETPYQPAFSKNPMLDFSILPYGTGATITPENTWGRQFNTEESAPARKPKIAKPKISRPETGFFPARKQPAAAEREETVQFENPGPARASVAPIRSTARPAQNNDEAYTYQSIVEPSSGDSGEMVPITQPIAPSLNEDSATSQREYEPLGVESDADSTTAITGAEGETMTPQEPQDPALETLPVTRSKGSRKLAGLQSDLNDVHSAINTLKTIQNQTSSDLNQMHQSLRANQDNRPGGEVTVEDETEESRSLLKAWGQYAAIDQDTNPIQSQLGRFRTESETLEKQIYKELRPMARAGWSYLTQDGEKTTIRLRGWSVPSQMALSLTPQLRVRHGFTGGKLYQPRVFTSPSSTGYQAYMLGATAKYWDRVTLDGDITLLHFDQSETVNLTYNSLAQIDFHDKVHMKIGSRRFQNPNSLLSLAGYRPFRGPWRGDLVGQVMETTIFTELNLLPFRNVDVNAGYEYAFVSGSETPTNHRNQVFFSTGYTIPYARDHAARLGYEFLFFTYSKDATLGFFNLDSGTDRPVVRLDPVTLAPNGTVFGGYFSPEYFFLNNFRLDLRGQFLKKFIEYRLGGSIGIQTFSFRDPIRTATPTSIASTFDGNVIMNFTDWLAGYMHGEMLKGGGAFNRFRFGGGLIIRPDIPALSPLFGKI